MCGMWPCVWFLGGLVIETGCGLSTHLATFAIVTCRRQRPVWMTSGMLAPTGAFFSENFPSGPVVVEMSGDPETSAVQLSHETPGVNAFTGAFGTYTSTLGSGSVPLGA